VKNPIYLYNNPNVFSGNVIDPNIVGWLISFSNLTGIKDSSEKIKSYKGYLEYLSEEFGVYCGREGSFSTFLQLTPPEKRIYAGIVPSIANIVNLCSNLYEASVHDETLEILKLQEELEDFREKIYDVQGGSGKQQRGLKQAFYSVYKDIIKSPLKEVFMVGPDFQPIEEVTVDRINATVNALKNMHYIHRYYPIGNEVYNIYDFNNIFLDIAELQTLGAIKKIKGPYEGKINVIYRMKILILEILSKLTLLVHKIKRNIN